MALALLCFYTFGQHVYPRWNDWRTQRTVNAAVMQSRGLPVQQMTHTIQGMKPLSEHRYAVSLAAMPTFREAPEFVTPAGTILSLRDEARQIHVFVTTSDEQHFASRGYSPCSRLLQEQKQAQSYLLVTQNRASTGSYQHEKCLTRSGYRVRLNRRFPELNGLIVACDAYAPADTPLKEQLLDEILTICRSVQIKAV